MNISTTVVIGDWIDIDEVVGQRLHYGPWVIEKSQWNTADYLRLQVEVNGRPRCIMGAYSILIKQCRAIEALGKTELNAVIEHYGEPADEAPDAGNQRRRRGGKNEKPRGFYCFAKKKKGATQQ